MVIPRSRSRFEIVAVGLMAFAATNIVAYGQDSPQDDYTQNEFPTRPVPAWVRMVDQGANDPNLAGIQTPAGIKVEIVAQEPTVIDPVGMTFADDGTPYVLQWRAGTASQHAAYEVTFADGSKATVNRMTKDTRDELKTLADTDGDGRYDSANVIMNDLEIPSSVLLHDGWAYLPSIGHVVRRRQSAAGGPYDVQEEIVRGLCGFHHHQASGLAISHDGWMLITSGDDDNRAEGSDGSRATVLRTGAIFRSRPDGSQVSEFARGFRNPYRDVSFDEFFNVFHVDNDQEDGSKFQGVRLMHIQEAADYGWRLFQGAVCCRTDFARGAAFGELPGKMPSMLKTGRGSPAGLLIYQGTRFPEFFRGLLIYPDVYRKLVRAYRVERDGSTFKVVEQFVLMTSDDGLFRPCQALQGPDGAIYIVDWRTDSGGAGRLWGDAQHGRIYRITWSGLEGTPAIPREPMDSWVKVRDADDDQLWKLIDGPDFEIRRRAVDELVQRGEMNRASFVSLAIDQQRAGPVRAAAIGGACRLYDESVERAMATLLGDDNYEIRRLAADAISRHTTADRAAAGVDLLLAGLADKHPAARRAKALALGNVASLLKQDDPLCQLASKSLVEMLQADDGSDVYLHDGILRGLERLGPTGMQRLKELMAGDPRQRELGVLSFESLRTREASVALDQLLESDVLSDLDFEHQSRLLAAYRHILVEPPIGTTAVVNWLKQHPDVARDVQITGLETIGLLGTDDSAAIADLAIKLLQSDDPEVRLRVIRAAGDMGVKAASGPLADALADYGRSVAERREIIAALSKLRSQNLPFLNTPNAPGVETVLDKIGAVALETKAGEIRGEALALLAQVSYEQAQPIAYQLLDSSDLLAAAAAINVLGARAEDVRQIGRRFAEGTIDRSLLPRVAEVLQRHLPQDTSGDMASLLKDAFQGGLLVSLEPSEIQRVEKLVRTTGDPVNGRNVFLDKQKGQCLNCHKLEGVGGQVGPDLSKIYDTHSVAKIIESMIDPSKEIKEGYATWTVITTDGKVYSGLRISETEKEIVLRDATGNDIRIPANEIEDKAETTRSLMPDGVISQLPYQHFIDLVAFLKDKQTQQELGTSMAEK